MVRRLLSRADGGGEPPVGPEDASKMIEGASKMNEDASNMIEWAETGQMPEPWPEGDHRPHMLAAWGYPAQRLTACCTHPPICMQPMHTRSRAPVPVHWLMCAAGTRLLRSKQQSMSRGSLAHLLHQ